MPEVPGKKREKIKLIFLIFLLDQSSKFFVSGKLKLNESIPVIKGVFHISLIHNYGAAFGILKNNLPLFIFSAVFAVILISRTLKKNKHQKLSLNNISLSLILAGALGNLVDRLRFGYVIDFLDFRIWPVFNLADSAITIGAVLLGWFMLRKNVSDNM